MRDKITLQQTINGFKLSNIFTLVSYVASYKLGCVCYFSWPKFFMCAESKQTNSRETLNTLDQREILLRASFSNTQGNVVYGVIKAARFGRVPEILNLCDNRRAR